MASDSDSSFGYPERGETQERSEPLSDDEMRKAIDKSFNEVPIHVLYAIGYCLCLLQDAVWDAATDVTIAAFKLSKLSPYDFLSRK